MRAKFVCSLIFFILISSVSALVPDNIIKVNLNLIDSTSYLDIIENTENIDFLMANPIPINPEDCVYYFEAKLMAAEILYENNFCIQPGYKEAELNIPDYFVFQMPYLENAEKIILEEENNTHEIDLSIYSIDKTEEKFDVVYKKEITEDKIPEITEEKVEEQNWYLIGGLGLFIVIILIIIVKLLRKKPDVVYQY